MHNVNRVTGGALGLGLRQQFGQPHKFGVGPRYGLRHKRGRARHVAKLGYLFLKKFGAGFKDISRPRFCLLDAECGLVDDGLAGLIQHALQLG